jgi:tetratricopeptide (TPR) repeat protein
VIDEALRLSERPLEPLARARIRAACLHRRIAVRGWSTEDASKITRALDEIRQYGTATDVAWHLIDCSWMEFYASDYRTVYRNVLASLPLLKSGDDANTYLSYAVAHWNCDIVVPWTLNLSGEWGAALRELDTRIARAERNADSHRRVLLLLSRMWVQLNAMDFASARDTGVSLLPALPHHLEDPTRRMCLVLAGAAEAGLGNYDAALQLLHTARDEMDSQTVISDWYRRLMLQWALTNLWLARGDLVRAREEGTIFMEHTSMTVEETWRGLAWEANARIALASRDFQLATDFSEKGIEAVQRVEAPVAAWQVYATAAAVARAHGDMAREAAHQEKSREIVRKLAASLGPNEDLRRTFLTAPAVRRALGEVASDTRFLTESFNNQTETAR